MEPGIFALFAVTERKVGFGTPTNIHCYHGDMNPKNKIREHFNPSPFPASPYHTRKPICMQIVIGGRTCQFPTLFYNYIELFLTHKTHCIFLSISVSSSFFGQLVIMCFIGFRWKIILFGTLSST